MTTVQPADSLDNLRQLLVEIDRDGLSLARELRRERELLAAGDSPVGRDLRRAELRFLQDRKLTDPDGEELARRVEEAAHEALDAELRDLRATPPNSVGALFDLAELRASYRLLGRHTDVETAGEVIAQRLEALVWEGPDAVSEDELLQEAGERYAALTTEEEAFELEQKIELLVETRDLLEALSKKAGSRSLARRMARYARRLYRQKCDRVLARRLESLLGRRGAALLENLSLIGLVAVFALLLVDFSLDLDPGTLAWTRAVDASVCLFFIVEFLLKLSLAPARGSWFLRNALTDLLPAIPAAMYLVPLDLPAAGKAEDAVALRLLRLVRITQFARYVQALRPALRIVRLVLFLIRGMDALVQRFSPLLNRDFVFFERASLDGSDAGATASRMLDNRDARSLLFQALRREHVLLSELPAEAVRHELEDRASALTRRLADSVPVPQMRTFGADPSSLAVGRDIPVEDAIAFLNSLRPEQVGLWLPRPDILALDRIVRVINAPVVRLLPLINLVSVFPSPRTAEERLAALGTRLALLLERWRERMLFFADLHGIVTGPQILDNVASAMVKFTKRPATRLAIFGVLFMLVQLILPSDESETGLLGFLAEVNRILGRIVATPLIVLGSVCIVLLLVGRWLKSLAGEANETFRMTSEAHFLSLLELAKRRSQDTDLEFLASRVFREHVPYEASGYITQFVRGIRTGRHPQGLDIEPALYDELTRVSYLYLHFLDGAPLHHTDVKTSEQLLANLSLENIRYGHLAMPRRERKRLRKLRLDEGSLLSGPYLWFRCITESIAVESAKRVIDYNRHALTKAQEAVAAPEQRARYARWLRRRRNQEGGRLEKLDALGAGGVFQSTEFHALDFLMRDDGREAYLEREFGRHLVHQLRTDRERMIREIFGTQPLHQRPRSKRSINFYKLYRNRLSGGRILLLPLLVVFAIGQSLKLLIQRTVEVAREILAPERAAEIKERGRAPFSVARRKIHRMKAPGLLEAMRLRVQFDPEYSGAPASWSERTEFSTESELERDMEFLQLRVREREEFRVIAGGVRETVAKLHRTVHRMGGDLAGLAGVEDPDRIRRGERAVTVAFLTDRAGLRTLAGAENVLEEAVARARSAEETIAGAFTRRGTAMLLRGFRSHPITRWIRTHRPDLGKLPLRVRGRLCRAWHAEGPAAGGELRDALRVWSALEPGVTPTERATEIALQVFRSRRDVSRELVALRAVQSLSVLDVRHYRKLVFDLGDYGGEGESQDLATALP